MDTVGDRLRWAVDYWNPVGDDRPSVAAFAREMAKAGVRGGTSLPSIYSYFRGDVQPTVEFVTAAADILGVRRAWLAFGEEPRRNSHAVSAEDYTSAVALAFDSWMAVGHEGWRVDGATRTAFAALVLSILPFLRLERSEFSADIAANWVMDALFAPAYQLMNLPIEDEQSFYNYLHHAIAAVQSLVPAAGAQGVPTGMRKGRAE